MPDGVRRLFRVVEAVWFLALISALLAGWTDGKVLTLVLEPPLQECKLIRLGKNSWNGYLAPVDKGTVAPDETGRAVVSLKPGDHSFAVAERLADGSLVCLLSDPCDGPQRTMIFNTVPVEAVDLAIGAEVYRITELAVRPANTTAEVVWQGKKAEDHVPVIHVSPGQEYAVRVRGLSPDGKTNALLWRSIKAKRFWRITGDRSDARVRFRWSAQAPYPAERFGVRVLFPRYTLDLEPDPQTCLITNRRFLRVAYWFDLPEKRRVHFWERGYTVRAGDLRPVDLEFGSPVEASAYAVTLLHPKPQNYRLFWGATVYDQAGHILDVEKSNIDYWQSAFMMDGSDVPTDALTGEQLKAADDPAETIRVRVSCKLEEPVGLVLTPEPFVEYKHGLATTKLPCGWEWLACTYLAKVNRAHGIIKDYGCGRPPAAVPVRWEAGGAAHGKVGRGGISMPFNRIISTRDWFASVFHLEHELLHNFGVSPGGPNGEPQRTMMRAFQEYVWVEDDDPSWTPEPFFIEGKRRF